MSIDALSTPCLLVDAARLQRNLTQMQEKAEAQDVRLRPHAKTHKSTTIARRQRRRGASGLTVATVGEADAFVDAGFDDVRIAYTVVGAEKHERVLGLMDRARLSFCVDTRAGAEAASAIYAAHDASAEVLMEIDVGHGRCGVPWDDAAATVALARRITELPGLRFVGILTHAGQAYDGPEENETPEEALQRVADAERDRMLAVAARLRDAEVPGVRPERFEISIGSTPTMHAFQNRTHAGFQVTEIRPGNYVFYDAMQVGLGAAALDDCALTVLATVVSVRRDGEGTRLYLDAGKKVVTSDTGARTDGYGVLLRDPATRSPMADARITGLSEEHGWVRAASDVPLRVGDRVQLIPNHACVTVHTQSAMHLIDGETVLDAIPIDARRKVGIPIDARRKVG